MQILLDANVPRRFKALLVGHDVFTAREMGLNELPDGLLLDAIEGQVDVLIMLDRSLQFQQRIDRRTCGVAVLRAKSNRLADLEPLFPELLRALPFIRPGQVREISA